MISFKDEFVHALIMISIQEKAIMDEIKEDPPKTDYTVPEGIKPTCRKMRVEVQVIIWLNIHFNG